MNVRPRKESFRVQQPVSSDVAFRRYKNIVYDHARYLDALCRWRVVQQINGDDSGSYFGRFLGRLALLSAITIGMSQIVFENSLVEVYDWITLIF